MIILAKILVFILICYMIGYSLKNAVTREEFINAGLFTVIWLIFMRLFLI